MIFKNKHIHKTLFIDVRSVMSCHIADIAAVTAASFVGLVNILAAGPVFITVYLFYCIFLMMNKVMMV